MMQFAEDQLLQLVGGLALLGVDAGLRQQHLGVDAGLFEQHPKAVVLRRQHGLVRRERRLDRRGLVNWCCRVNDLLRRRRDRAWNDLQRAITHHGLQFGDHLLHPQRLAEEAAVDRPFRLGWFHLTGDQDDLDVGPAVVHRVGQLQAVHAAGHLNVGEQQGYVRAGLQNRHRLVGIDGFDRAEPGILHDIDRTHAQHHFVLDDEDVRHFG